MKAPAVPAGCGQAALRPDAAADQADHGGSRAGDHGAGGDQLRQRLHAALLPDHAARTQITASSVPYRPRRTPAFQGAANPRHRCRAGHPYDLSSGAAAAGAAAQSSQRRRRPSRRAAPAPAPRCPTPEQQAWAKANSRACSLTAPRPVRRRTPGASSAPRPVDHRHAAPDRYHSSSPTTSATSTR